MSLSRSLRLIALTLFSIFSVALSMQGSDPLLRQPLQLRSGVNASFAHPECFAQQNVSKDKGQAASATPKTYTDKPTSLAERIRVTKLMNDHIEEVKKQALDFQVMEFPWLPGYYIKTDSTRIAGAKALSDFIKEHKLKYVTVPEKWLYRIPKDPLSPLKKFIDGTQIPRELVIAKKLEGTHDGIMALMNAAQAKDVCHLLAHATYNNKYYTDIHSGNLLRTTDGRIGFIDTESRGFWGNHPQDTITYPCCLYAFLSLSHNSKLNHEAKEIFLEKLAQLKQEHSNKMSGKQVA